jgi:hypothetical protein
VQRDADLERVKRRELELDRWPGPTDTVFYNTENCIVAGVRHRRRNREKHEDRDEGQSPHTDANARRETRAGTATCPHRNLLRRPNANEHCDTAEPLDVGPEAVADSRPRRDGRDTRHGRRAPDATPERTNRRFSDD